MAPGQLSNVTATPQTPSCVYTASSVSCNGFGGSSSFTYPGNNVAYVRGPPSFSLDVTGPFGQAACAYTASRVNLGAVVGGAQGQSEGVLAFSAAFAFTVDAASFTPSSRGFSFLLNDETTSCGDG